MDWDEMARPWLEAADGLEASMKDVFQALFAAAELQKGERVLDVGCGTGPTLATASELVGDKGMITGIDIAPPLAARAKERGLPNVNVVVGDAGTYPFDNAAYDKVIANFGVMFFADNVAGFRNLRSAIKPGGRMAATVWAAPIDNPWFAVPRKIVDEFVADVPRPDPAGPGPMRFAKPEGLAAILEEAGWRPDIQTIDLLLRPPGTAKDAADLHMLVTAGMMLQGMDVEEAALNKIHASLATAMASYDVDGEIHVPARIHVISAEAV